MPTTTLSASSRSTSSDATTTLRTWLSIFAASFVLYALLANRGAQWQDGGFHILRVVTGQSSHPLGLALTHPLHHWLGRLVVLPDLLEPCFAITLLSGVAGAAAVANTFGCVVALTRNRTAALLAAGSLGLASTFMRMATLVEIYTLTAALLTAECWCVIIYVKTRRPQAIRGAFLMNGLGLSNHLLALLTTPVLLVLFAHSYWKGETRIKDAAVAPILWLIGGSLYLTTVLVELIGSGDLGGTIHSALFGHSFAEQVLNLSPSLRLLGISGGFVVLNFPNLLLPAAVWGIFRASRLGVPLHTRWALLGGLILHACFVLRYPVVDQHTFLIPTYVFLAIFGGVGFARLLEQPRTKFRRWAVPAATVLLILTPAFYAITPSMARKLDVLRSVEHRKPYRDDYVYLFTPWAVVERSADRMSREAVDLAGDAGLILFEDPMAESALRYRALRDDKRGVEIMPHTEIRSALDGSDRKRPIVLVPLDRDAPKTDPQAGAWDRMGDLYVWRESS